MEGVKLKVAEYVMQCAILAILLEVSGYPKPGNVHRVRDSPETRFEHFLAGAVAIGPAMGKLAENGFKAETGEISLRDISVGRFILEAVDATAKWQRGGNTNLGTVLLFSPLSAAAGMCIASSGGVSVDELRGNVVKVIDGTTVDDAVKVYDAIQLAKPGGMGKVSVLDVNDPESKRKIASAGLTLKDVFAVSAGWDGISEEWVNGMRTVFTIGYPAFKKHYAATGDVNVATVNTFLTILSEKPDTLIARKAGADAARYVSSKAEAILNAGGIETPGGRRLCWMLDEELHKAKGKLNPGTTADLTAASIFVCLLEGLRY